MRMASQTRHTWIDALRLIAGLSMVGLHATADPNGQPWPDYSAADRIGPIVLRAILYVARTELFIIISIFLLLMALDRRPRGYGAVMAEQSRRLLVPFAFWTLFYAAYGLIKASEFGYVQSALAELGQGTAWVGYVLLGDVKYHMHFIPTLFGVLLFFPLYTRAVAHPWLGIGVLVGLLSKLHLDDFIYTTFWGHEAVPYLVRGTKILTYAGYGMVAGAAFGIWKRRNETGLITWLPLLLFVGGLLALFKAIASYKTIQMGAYPFGYGPGYWADFLMPAVLFFGCMTLAHRRWPAVLSRLAPYSFGIYLCHPIFLDLAEIACRGSDWSPLLQVSVKIGATLCATCLFVFVISRMRLLSWTIGLGPLPFLFSSRQKLKEPSHNAV